jgi:hypothetical protein
LLPRIFGEGSNGQDKRGYNLFNPTPETSCENYPPIGPTKEKAPTRSMPRSADDVNPSSD